VAVLEARVTALEVRVTALEVEFGTMSWQWKDFRKAQTRAVKAIQLTQAEHTKAIGWLSAQGEGMSTRIAGLQAEVDGLRKTQLEHGRILNEHSRILNEHGQILNELRLGMAEVVGFVKYLMAERNRSSS
jgi:uncharacterized protein YlxW (UPF0749 family)